MNIQVRAYTEKDLPDMIRIWNEVVEDGVAFPQEEFLTEKTGKTFFAEQTGYLHKGALSLVMLRKQA